MAKKGTSVSKTDESNLPSEVVPDFMKGKGGRGTEALGAQDVEVPRIMLLQAVSPQVNEGLGLPGEFYHLVSEISLGKEVRIVPLYTDVRYILWRPRDDGGGILARADDGVHWTPDSGTFEVKLKGGKKVTWKLEPTVLASGLSEWGSSDPDDSESQPAATRMYCMVVALPDYPELGPALLTLQRASIKVARRMVSKLKISAAPSYGCYFRMGSKVDEGPNGKFHNYSFTADGFVSNEVEFKKYEEMYEQFKKMGIKIKDIEGIQEDEDVASSDGGTSGDREY